MLYENWFKNPGDVPLLLEKIAGYSQKTGPIRLMEVCGTHTMSIARSGIKSILPENVQLLSGPGCPVCVTPANIIDMILSLSKRKEILIASYGDLLRVPGSIQGESLLKRRAGGANVESVYSPMDALQLAEDHPEKEVVFLGAGFETTAPGTAACILEAAARRLTNFSVLCLLKQTEPALRSLIEAPDFAVDGFLCPGHVAAIIGADRFSFLPDDYRLPGVVAGFEAADLLYSILELTRMLAENHPALKNEYTRLVRHPRGICSLGRHEKVLSGSAGSHPDSGLSVRSGHPGCHPPCRLSAVPERLLTVQSGGALHGIRRGCLRRSVSIRIGMIRNNNTGPIRRIAHDSSCCYILAEIIMPISIIVI